ncbi:pilus biosynthesis protein [Betaproteobacteria bacterium]|nr:pilus biosynthesis protein [Betaproteobacteria bacterium]GHU40777.1 pilus biosynthesis protein [Betaproteobacteria bacterium]
MKQHRNFQFAARPLGCAVTLAFALYGGVAQGEIANAPLIVGGGGVAPNVMYIHDDSGSMYAYIHYDSNQDYPLPPNRHGTGTLPQPPVTAAWFDGYRYVTGEDTRTVNLSIGDDVEKIASDPTNPLNFVWINYDIGEPDTKFRLDGSWNGYSSYMVKTPTIMEGEKYARWFSYYRTRHLAAKAAISFAFADLDPTIRIGYGSLNNHPPGTTVYKINAYTAGGNAIARGVRPFTDSSVPDPGNPNDVNNCGATDYRCQFYKWLYSLIAPGHTPLPRTLDAAGKYYQTDEPWRNDPLDKKSTMATCRKSATILMTDGEWTNWIDDIGIGNWDGGKGSPFEDKNSSFLADVAMKYWKTDLRPDLDNNLPVRSGARDTATWQHMATYTVGVGVNAKLSKDAINNAFSYITHPSPPPFDWGTHRVDDLVHAAVNGHGSYYQTQNAQDFAAALTAMLNEISHSSVTAVAPVGGPSTSSQASDRLYQGVFHTDGWNGNLAALKINNANGKPIYPALWDAKDHIPAYGSRKIFTWNGTSGTAFTWTGISESQKTALGSEAVLNYLRGSNAGEGATFRSRTKNGERNILGDIINSAPRFIAKDEDFGHALGSLTASYNARKASPARTKNMVYVGANDGMLHAFDAATGNELFAYVPNGVFDHLKDLSDPEYDHRFYVDGSPVASDIQIDGAWKTVLVGSTGAGGKSYFALDVEAPDSFDASKVLWEVNNTTAGFENLGFTLGYASIVRLNNGVWAAVFGNGYESGGISGNPAYQSNLFIVNAKTGTLIKKIPTNAGSATAKNGLSTPLLVDVDKNGTADVAYAGDLQGNLWKFDLSGTSAESWKVAFNGKPLLIARNPANGVQPITAQPAGAERPAGGYMVYVGTGKFFETGDNANTEIQTFYGVRDNGSSSETKRVNLLKQTISASAAGPGYRVASGGTVDYSTQRGFYLDLTDQGERLISPPLLTKRRLYLNSLVPVVSTDPCASGNLASWLTELTLFDGAAPAASVFDPDKTDDEHTNSMRLDGGGGGIAQKGRYGYVSKAEGDDGIEKFKLPGILGRQSWRQMR